MPPQANERGVVLLAAILLLLVLMGLGMATMNLATQELEGFHTVRETAAARQLAAAGVEMVRHWFQNPRAVAESGRPAPQAALFTPQSESRQGGLSFFDDEGRSQFRGTAAEPDLMYDAAIPSDDRLLNDPQIGWFRPLLGVGRILMLRVYGPGQPGLLCTVEVTVAVGRLKQTTAVQLGLRAIPPLRAALQAGQVGLTPAPPPAVPVWVHWGDVKWQGDGRLGSGGRVPRKSALAPITGQRYAQMAGPEDRWLDVLVGGALVVPRVQGRPLAPPAHLRDRQDPLPGLDLDHWDYDAMKRKAQRYGTYYRLGRDGRLYRPDDHVGDGVTPEDGFRSLDVGDHRGLVFVDTLDGQAPRQDNLGTIRLQADYLEGIFVVNAHVTLAPRGPGRPVSVLSPPEEGYTGPNGRVPVRLPGVHLNGVLYTTGSLAVEADTHVFGAVTAEGGLITSSADTVATELLEVWYNHDLRNGLLRGMPHVYVAQNTLQEW